MDAAKGAWTRPEPPQGSGIRSKDGSSKGRIYRQMSTKVRISSLGHPGSPCALLRLECFRPQVALRAYLKPQGHHKREFSEPGLGPETHRLTAAKPHSCSRGLETNLKSETMRNMIWM